MQQFFTATSNMQALKFCLARATECRRKAEQATGPYRQRSWRDLEGRWFFLARSYDNER